MMAPTSEGRTITTVTVAATIDLGALSGVLGSSVMLSVVSAVACLQIIESELDLCAGLALVIGGEVRTALGQLLNIDT